MVSQGVLEVLKWGPSSSSEACRPLAPMEVALPTAHWPHLHELQKLPQRKLLSVFSLTIDHRQGPERERDERQTER